MCDIDSGSVTCAASHAPALRNAAHGPTPGEIPALIPLSQVASPVSAYYDLPPKLLLLVVVWV